MLSEPCEGYSDVDGEEEGRGDREGVRLNENEFVREDTTYILKGHCTPHFTIFPIPA
jgi:hypothetical protein